MRNQNQACCRACGSKQNVRLYHVLYVPELTIFLCGKCRRQARLVARGKASIVRRYFLGAQLLDELSNIEHGRKLLFLRGKSKDLGVYTTELYRYMRFVRKFPDLKTFIDKYPDYSWSKIVRELLF